MEDRGHTVRATNHVGNQGKSAKRVKTALNAVFLLLGKQSTLKKKKRRKKPCRISFLCEFGKGDSKLYYYFQQTIFFAKL